MIAFDDSPAWADARPTISVLMPFLRDDPTALLGLLDREAAPLAGAVEIVVLDDGTIDPALTDRLRSQIAALALPIRLITLFANEGRSKGRNRLAQTARGDFLLFLDSDMRPDDDRFLQTWAALARDERPAVVFGGFSLRQAPTESRFAVHRAMATRSECLDAATRSLAPEKYVYTSNLLVRRDVFDQEAFDPAFTGWGWEDVEWAMRVSRRHPIRHIDNPATHMGLDTVQILAGKYEQSAANFARVVERHPDIVTAYPSFQAARTLKRVPGLSIVRRALLTAIVRPVLPTRMRAFALRLYRASLYADVV